jgi:hypothetical protein
MNRLVRQSFLGPDSDKRLLLAAVSFLATDRNDWCPDGRPFQDVAFARLPSRPVRRGPLHVPDTLFL